MIDEKNINSPITDDTQKVETKPEKKVTVKKTKAKTTTKKSTVKKKIEKPEKKVRVAKVAKAKKTATSEIKPAEKPAIKVSVNAGQPLALPPGDEDVKNEDLLRTKNYYQEAKKEVEKEINASGFNTVDAIKKEPEKKPVMVNPIKPANVNVGNKDVYRPQSLKTILDNKKQEEPEEKPKHSLKLYRNIVLIFVAAAVVLAVGIGYFTLVSVTITIIPNQENMSNNIIFDVYDTEKNQEIANNAIPGVVRKVSIDTEKTYTATGEEVIGQEAIGTAKLINNYEKNQPLVATTRLLSADGKLFRIKNTVNVPAGGSIDVEIYADQPSPEMAIGPTRFTIPGLWAGLQDKIYAQSEKEVVYQQKVKKHVASEDIENSKRDLKQEIANKAKEQIQDTYKEFGQVIYSVDDSSVSSKIDAKVGDEKEEFSGKMSADVIVVAFNDEKAKELAKQKFILSLPENKESMNFNSDSLIYALNTTDFSKGIASLNATFEGKVTLKDDYGIVDTSKILGLNKDQLEAYLSGLPDIAGHEVKFSPSFMWKVPKYIEPSKIKVEIKK